MEVCPLSRRVILRVCSTRIRPIARRLSLSPSSCTHISVGFPYGLLSLSGEIWAYHVSFSCLSGLGSPYSPEGCVFTRGEHSAPLPPSSPFGASLSASLACLQSRRLDRCLHLLTIPLILAPYCIDARSSIILSRF
jgi:hypothetical protein